MIETNEASLLETSSAIVTVIPNKNIIEEELSKKIKTKNSDCQKFIRIGSIAYNNIKSPIVEPVPEKVEQPLPEIEENSYIDDNSFANEENKFYSEPKYEDPTVEEIKQPISVDEPIVNDSTIKNEYNINRDFSINNEVVKDVTTLEKPKLNEVYNSHYEPTPVPPSYGVNYSSNYNNSYNAAPVQSPTEVIEKVNQKEEPKIINIDEFKNNLLSKDSYGRVETEVLDSEIPALDNLIKLYEKLKKQLEKLKEKLAEKEEKKSELTKEREMIDDFLGKTLTFDFTAIKKATQGISGAGEAFEELNKSVEKIQLAQETSKKTLTEMEEEIKNIKENIEITEKEIEETKEESYNKCFKIKEALKTARTIDEKEEAINKQLEILLKQKEALTNTLTPKEEKNAFDKIREESEYEEEVSIRRVA